MIEAIIETIAEAVHQVLPLSRKLDQWLKTDESGHPMVSAFIGVTGDYEFNLLLESSLQTFSLIGEGMYGMKLDESFTESFVGELLNMIGGHFTTIIQEKACLDITPPVVQVGMSQRHHYESSIHIPLEIEELGHIHIYTNFAS